MVPGLEIASLGVRLTSLDETGSTNADALAAARAGDPGPHWFVARRQRAGRGRGGRGWVSEPGNLHATLLIGDVAPRIAAQLGFVAGLALHEAVSAVTGLDAGRLRIKWPNDLLLDGAKLAGILLEAETQGEGRLAVVIGFGVNVAAAPEGLPYPAAALGAVSPAVEVSTLFAALTRSMAARLGQWRGAHARGEPDAFAAIRRRWLDLAAGLGQPITVRLPRGERNGRFAGLDETGRLMLDAADGRHLIDAGDVILPAAGPPRVPTMTDQGW